jgi:hypothetical protein
MQRWWQIVALFVAVATIIGHSFIPHHHNDGIKDITHHLHNDEDHDAQANYQDDEQGKQDHHNLFSFAQLDEDFVPVKFNKVSFDLPILYLLTPVISHHISQIEEPSKNNFGYYREFPPPHNYIPQLFSRPPPAC